MVKKVLIAFALLIAFIAGGLGTDIFIEYQPIEIEPKDAKMFQEAKLYLDTTAENKSSNWWCSKVEHQGDSTLFFFWDGTLPNIDKSKLFGLIHDIQETPHFGEAPMVLAFYKGIFIGNEEKDNRLLHLKEVNKSVLDSLDTAYQAKSLIKKDTQVFTKLGDLIGCLHYNDSCDMIYAAIDTSEAAKAKIDLVAGEEWWQKKIYIVAPVGVKCPATLQ